MIIYTEECSVIGRTIKKKTTDKKRKKRENKFKRFVDINFV